MYQAVLASCTATDDLLPGQPPLVEGRVQRLSRWLRARTAWQLMGLTTAAALAARIAGLPLVLAAHALFGKTDAGPDVRNSSLTEAVLLAMVLAPLLETLLSQLAVLRLLGKISALRDRPWIPILISALLFAGMHCYSIGYMVNTFGVGLVLAVAFQVAGRTGRAFWVVAGAHACLNGLFTLIARSGLVG